MTLYRTDILDARAKPFDGERVLVIEDEYFIADEVEFHLTNNGARIVGPAANLKSALALLDEYPVDCALLDINLQGKAVFPITAALHERGIPWIYLTGYDPKAVPPDLRGAAHLEKPIDRGALIKALVRCLARGE